MFRVKRDYGNGFIVDVEGETMLDVINDLTQADEVFYDVRAFGKDESGKLVSSDRVKFQVRNVKGQDGREYDYHEQVCTEGPLKWYKRSVGVFNDKTGRVFVKKGPPKDAGSDKIEMGFAGWHKYVGGQNQNGSYGQSNGHQQSYQQAPQQQPAPQQQYSQPVQHQAPPQYQQAAPQQQFNPHAAPSYATASMEDVPF